MDQPPPKGHAGLFSSSFARTGQLGSCWNGAPCITLQLPQRVSVWHNRGCVLTIDLNCKPRGIINGKTMMIGQNPAPPVSQRCQPLTLIFILAKETTLLSTSAQETALHRVACHPAPRPLPSTHVRAGTAAGFLASGCQGYLNSSARLPSPSLM